MGARECRRDRHHAGSSHRTAPRRDVRVPRRRAWRRPHSGDGARLDDRPPRLRGSRRGGSLPGRCPAAEGGMTAAVVSFDLDETLWAFMPMMDGSLRAAIAALEERHPAVAGRISVERLHDERQRVAEEREGTYIELRLESFRRVLAAHDLHDPDL